MSGLTDVCLMFANPLIQYSEVYLSHSVLTVRVDSPRSTL